MRKRDRDRVLAPDYVIRIIFIRGYRNAHWSWFVKVDGITIAHGNSKTYENADRAAKNVAAKDFDLHQGHPERTEFLWA